MHGHYLQILKQYGLLDDDESSPDSLKAGAKVPLNYAVLDALTHLMALLVNFLDSVPTAKLQVLNHAVGAIANALVSAHDL
ncbi:hypothetical protein PsorP6_007320 [Peronosclerospora sorghi]|uniref:Uncharacterized protein n=1 Tax=Peronosclerospora sorghi TaxID=230839 RepID=A0ACC0W8U7_9STRA|nr:hypothetical protein PsorP6_007320 [Peronosclerospora sorghi]